MTKPPIFCTENKATATLPILDLMIYIHAEVYRGNCNVRIGCWAGGPTQGDA